MGLQQIALGPSGWSSGPYLIIRTVSGLGPAHPLSPHCQKSWHCELFYLCDEKSKERILNCKDVDLVKANNIAIESFSIAALVAKICWCQNVGNRGFIGRHCANFSGNEEPVCMEFLGKTRAGRHDFSRSCGVSKAVTRVVLGDVEQSDI